MLKYLPFQSFILLAMEGVPVQEVAAIEVNRTTLAIIDVFHGYANTEEEDKLGRDYIHGLSEDYLRLFGQPSEQCLLSAYLSWLSKKHYTCIFSNKPRNQLKVSLPYVYEYWLPSWANRKTHASHQLAKRYKEQCIPICKRSCPQIAHSSFKSASPDANVIANETKVEYGYRCALYGAIELYFEYVMT